MKIAYVVPFKVVIPSNVAHTVNIMNMCGAMSELGHDVTLILPKTNATDEQIFSHYGVKRFSIKRVRSFSSKWLYPLYSLIVLKQIRQIQPELVTGRSAITCFFASLSGYKIAYDSHAPAWLLGRFNFWAYLLLRSSSNLTRMTVNSEALREMYIDSGYAPHCPLVTAHNGSQEHPLDEVFSNWPQRENALQIGYAGHLYKGRGVEVLIASAKALPQHDFHIVGGNPEDMAYWKEQSPYANLYFHGFVPPSQVHKFRNMMDILLAPYPKSGVKTAGGKEDSSKYMNPIKIIEYMSSKKAIVASDLPPVREILDESRAILVDADHSQEWVEAIKKLGDENLRKDLSGNAYRYFQAQLTWKARARKLIGDNA